MDETKPRTRRKLNVEQLEVLTLLYKFRFGTNDLFAEYFGKKDRSFVFKRLSILLEQELIGKRFDSSYRLQGKPAAYYITPEGARRLQEARGTEVNVRTIYKDKSVSEQFVAHCLGLFRIYSVLRKRYGDEFKLFTKSDLSSYDYFPSTLPAAYIRLKDGEVDKHFFLHIYHDHQPIFAVTRRVKQYIEYAESGEWETTGTELPAVLVVCESDRLQKQLLKKITLIMNQNIGTDVVFAICSKASLISNEPEPWQLTDGVGAQLSLRDIS